MSRYGGFAGSPALATVKAELADALPLGVTLDLNQMYTQRPDGTVVLGDTHQRDVTVSPFQPEAAFSMFVDSARTLFEADHWRIVERWQGIYATAPQDFLMATPDDGVHVASVTTGIGMTTGFGLAAHVMTPLLQS